MTFQRKSALMVFVAGSTLLLAMTLIYYVIGRRVAVEQAHPASVAMAKDIAHSLDLLLIGKGRVANTMACAPILTQALIRSTAEYAELEDSERQNRIEEQNGRWLAARDAGEAIIQSVLNNSIADYLRKQQATFAGEYGEIFVTNRYGVVVAATGRLTTFAHAHKYWWQASYNQGEGKTFFDDRGYDLSVDGYVLGVVVPIRHGTEVVGILKCNLNIQDALVDVLHLVDHHDDSESLKLVRTGGLVVLEENAEPLSTEVSAKLVDELKTGATNTIEYREDEVGKVISYTPVSIAFDSDIYGFGGSTMSIDHSRGNEGEGWHIVRSQSISTITGSTERSAGIIAAIGLLFCLILAGGSAFLGRTLAQPIMMLVEHVRRIGHGNLDTRVEITTKDEIGMLATSFNTMARDLRQTMISRDELVEEIEQRKTTEKELQQTQAILQAAMDNSQAGIAIADAENGRLRYVNDAALRIRGSTSKEVLEGIDVDQYVASWQIFDLEGKPLATDEVPLARAILHGETGSRELIVRRTDDDDRIVWVNAAPIMNQQGEVTAGIAIFLDITERKQFERALSESEERFRELFEQAGDALFLQDLEGRLIQVNKQACQSLGYTRDELLSMHAWDIEVAWNRESLGDLRQSLATNTAVPAKGTQRRKDGSTFPVEVQNSLFHWDNEDYVLVLARDISDRVATEQVEMKYKERLKSAASKLTLAEDQLRQEIAAGLHDSVGQNLAAVKISLALLKRSLGSADDPVDPKVMATLVELEETVNSIIETTWTLTFELCPPGLHEMGITVAVEWLVKQLAERNGHIVFQSHSDISDKPLAHEVRGLVFQMIRELILNAIKHAQTDSIELFLAREKDELQIVVNDNGCGFDTTQESSSNSLSGGFGLFNIRERLRYYSGSIDIDSIVGEGTRITLRFPLDL